MNRRERLSRKWAYIFIIICIAAFVVAAIALMREEWVIAAACGFVGGAQILNLIKWKKQR